MKRTFHRGVFSNKSVRYAGNHSDITTRNIVTYKDHNTIKSKKIQFCKRCNTRVNCTGIRYDFNSYGNNYKMKKNINYKNIINDDLQAINDVTDFQDDY
jgi:hypothetical protein